MQVAGLGAYFAPSKRDHQEGGLASKLIREQARASAEIHASETSINILQVVQHHQITVQEVKQISPWGLKALAYIAGSSRLSPEDRRTLIRLVAIVDEFAGGDPKLMRDIIGIAKIMEMNAKQNYKPMSLREALKLYFEERERFDPSQQVTINVEAEIQAVSVQYTDVSVSESVDVSDETSSGITA